MNFNPITVNLVAVFFLSKAFCNLFSLKDVYESVGQKMNYESIWIGWNGSFYLIYNENTNELRPMIVNDDDIYLGFLGSSINMEVLVFA